jgi:hypothetical protein
LNPSKSNMSVLNQIVKLIPVKLIDKLADKHKVSSQCRSFSAASHVVAMFFGQLSHALSLNDICDSLRHHSGALSQIRGATPPSRNALSHANAIRNADMAEELFWTVLGSLGESFPAFITKGRKYPGVPRRFKRTINAIDSSTMQLVANCMNWAKHRRRKAAAKMHLRLNIGSFLPACIVVCRAKDHDSKIAWELCAGMKSGEIAVFDKAYVDFEHLHSLQNRGVFWVTRSKDNMAYDTVGQHTPSSPNIIHDIRIILTCPKSLNQYPEELRLVEAMVEVDGKPKVMTFITNNMEWAPSSICDLYRSRWGVEVFFKEIKQTLQLADFMGYSENAIRWQVWMALLVYLLLRFISWQSKWKHSFNRIFTAVRGVIWNFFDLFSVLACCGTAGGLAKMHADIEQLYLPGYQ